MLTPLRDLTGRQTHDTSTSLRRSVHSCRCAALYSNIEQWQIPGDVVRVGGVSVLIVAIFLSLLSTAEADEVCHRTGSGAQLTVDVPPEDVADHLAHGDSLGPCIPPQVEVPYTCSASTLFYNKLFVRPGATPPMKGTVDRPFSKVSAALEYAARKRFGAVEVQVAPGSYGQDSATITRPTRIVGPGRDGVPTAELALSIDHRSTHELGIQGVLFRPNGLKPGLTVRTAAPVNDPRGHTALCNVGYEQVVGHAVAQVGGSISADDIVVRNTRRHPDASFLNVLSGTAFIFGSGLGGSIDALLKNSFAFDSESTGIVVSGASTSVTLNAVALSGGQGCFGGLFVSNAAEVLGSHVRIGGVRLPDDRILVNCDPDDPDCVAALPKDPNEDPNDPPEWPIDFYGIEGLDHVAGQPIALTGNRHSGVYALGTTVLAGSDTFVGIDDLVVRQVSLDGNELEECGFNAASSLVAARGADITIERFILDASALIGLMIDATGSIIFGEWSGSTINASNGVVSNNPIATNVQHAEYDLRTLQDNVAFVNNVISLDSDELQVPSPTLDLDSL